MKCRIILMVTSLFLVLNGQYLEAQACSNLIEIRCSPEGDDWQVESRAVAKWYDEDGEPTCTGTLLNNTNFDQKGLFLTAAHCLDSDLHHVGGTFDFSFRWNFERIECVNDNNYDTYYTTHGATILMINHASDIALFEIDLSALNGTGYVPYFAGWDVSGDQPSSGVMINHPGVEDKKIALIGTIESFDVSTPSPPLAGPREGNFWHMFFDQVNSINGWSCIFNGSSGSALFDQNKRVIGQLAGSPGGTPGTPTSGKISFAWTGDNDPSNGKRLDHWLDPQNVGQTTIDGLDPNAPCLLSVNVTKRCGQVHLYRQLTIYACWLEATAVNAVGPVGFEWEGSSNSYDRGPVMRYSCGTETYTVTATDSTTWCTATATGTILGIPRCHTDGGLGVALSANPIRRGGALSLYVVKDLTAPLTISQMDVRLVDIRGNSHQSQSFSLSNIEREMLPLRVNPRNSGVYFLQFSHRGQVFQTERLVVE